MREQDPFLPARDTLGPPLAHLLLDVHGPGNVRLEHAVKDGQHPINGEGAGTEELLA